MSALADALDDLRIRGGRAETDGSRRLGDGRRIEVPAGDRVVIQEYGLHVVTMDR